MLNLKKLTFFFIWFCQMSCIRVWERKLIWDFGDWIWLITIEFIYNCYLNQVKLTHSLLMAIYKSNKLNQYHLLLNYVTWSITDIHIFIYTTWSLRAGDMLYNYRIELLCSSMLPSARLGLPWPLHLNISGQQSRTVLVCPITNLFHGVSTFKSIKHRKPNFIVK